MSVKSPSVVDAQVGARIKFHRMAAGMTQQGLAEMLGITFQQLQKYEKGANRVGASRLHRIAVLLDVSPASFFDGANTTNGADQKSLAQQADYPATLVRSSDGFAIARAFSRIKSRRRRRALVKLADAMAES